MPQFTDTNGREWKVSLNVTLLKAVREYAQLDLADLEKAPETFTRLADDPVLLVDVLYLLCEEQAKTVEMSDADFGRALAGDAIGHATDALEEAIVAFFPPQKRSFLQRLRTKLQNVRDNTVRLVEANLEDPEINQAMMDKTQRMMDEAREKALTELRSVTNSPEPPEASIPAPGE